MLMAQMLFIQKIFFLWFLSHNFNVKCDDAPSIKLEDIIVDLVNGSYLDEETLNIEVIYHHQSRNGLSIHLDIINELPPTLYVKINALGRAFGRYVVPTGININVNYACDEKLKKIFLDQIWENVGVDTAYCPPKPGSYENLDFPADMPGIRLYALPGYHVQISVEIYGVPDHTYIMKCRSFLYIS